MKEPPPDSSEAPVIEMKNVSFAALRDQSMIVGREINWTVQRGDYWVLAGLEDSGKTDFLMLAGGLMPPAAGTYRFFGEDMPIYEDARIRERLRLGVVFDGGQLFNHFTVADNVALPLRYHQNLSKADAQPELASILDALELTPWAHSTPGAIGRNWQKRVGLARALMLRPEVLLVDNPLGGLDLRHASWWLAFLGRLSQGHPLFEGKPLTIVTTAAEFSSWRWHAKQFAVLRDHHLVVLGTWRQVEEASDELLHELMAAKEHRELKETLKRERE